MGSRPMERKTKMHRMIITVMVKSILLCDFFNICQNLISWLISEQCHILNDAVACSRFSVSVHDRG